MRNSIQRLLLIVLPILPCTVLAQDGSLVTSFDTTGRVYTPFASGSHDEAWAVAVQKDGRIIAAGKSEGKFAMARYGSNGLLDSSFGTNGKQTTDMYGGDGAKSMLIQPDGKIILVGTGYVGQFAVARYDTSGILDPTFAGSGWNMVGVGSSCYGWGSALQPDGKILVAGKVSGDFLIMRFTTAGSLDATFGNSGIVRSDFGGYEEASGVAVQSNGKIVVAGSSNNYSGFLVARYKENGVIDSTFGTNGKVVTSIGTSYDNAYAVAIQSDGKILVAGYGTFTYSEFSVARYDTSGVLDATFGTNGIVSTWFGHGNDIPYGIAVQLDGKIVVAGVVTNQYGEYDFGVVRYNNDGSYDNSFGSNGLVTTDMGSTLDYGNAVAIAPSGNIVVAGQSLVPTGRYSFALAEYQGSSGPLPVEIVSFSAKIRESSVVLTWKTATEVNCSEYDIERLQNDKLSNYQNSNWQMIGHLEGHGTSNIQHPYSYTDENVSPGKYTYRLKQIDRDGNFSYSKEVIVEAGGNSVQMKFELSQNYPNPFNPETQIGYTIPVAGFVSLKIYDVIGREIKTLVHEVKEIGTYSTTFEGYDIPSGLYVARLESGGRMQFKKMLLMK